MANSWRESIFSLAIYFSELPNHDIYQVNFGKLLEMLLNKQTRTECKRQRKKGRK
jgi:hypothetical protein